MTADTPPPIPQGFRWTRGRWYSPHPERWTLFPADRLRYQRVSAVTVRPVEVTTARGSTRRAWVASVRHGQNRYESDPCRTRDAAARAVLFAAGVTARDEVAA